MHRSRLEMRNAYPSLKNVCFFFFFFLLSWFFKLFLGPCTQITTFQRTDSPDRIEMASRLHEMNFYPNKLTAELQAKDFHIASLNNELYQLQNAYFSALNELEMATAWIQTIYAKNEAQNFELARTTTLLEAKTAELASFIAKVQQLSHENGLLGGKIKSMEQEMSSNSKTSKFKEQYLFGFLGKN